jgi:hypothetical protein
MSSATTPVNSTIHLKEYDMTITISNSEMTTGSAQKASMRSLRRNSLAAGVCYLVSFISIPSIGLYKAVKDPTYITSAGSNTPAMVAGLLEIIVALAGIGTAVALYPVVKKQNEGIALGFVGVRVLEAATIFAGVVSLLSIVTLRTTGAGVGALSSGRALVAQYHWTFLFGQATLPGISALLLGSLMYRSGLVPKILPVIGLIGAPLLLASVVAKYFGVYDEDSVWSLLGALPVAVWEFSLGVYLVVKGFRPCAITAELTGGQSR